MNVCGDVALAVYGPETVSADEAPTQPTATATLQVVTADSRISSSAVKSAELNVPEIVIRG